MFLMRTSSNADIVKINRGVGQLLEFDFREKII